jgi:hypothetical protein
MRCSVIGQPIHLYRLLAIPGTALHSRLHADIEIISPFSRRLMQAFQESLVRFVSKSFQVRLK